jgi:hypothetical protein
MKITWRGIVKFIISANQKLFFYGSLAPGKKKKARPLQGRKTSSSNQRSFEKNVSHNTKTYYQNITNK